MPIMLEPIPKSVWVVRVSKHQLAELNGFINHTSRSDAQRTPSANIMQRSASVPIKMHYGHRPNGIDQCVGVAKKEIRYPFPFANIDALEKKKSRQ